jgi:hypothetical protein
MISTKVRLLIVAISAAAFSVSAAPHKDLQLFLLVGQSNMAGRGKVTEADRKPHPRVLMLTKAGEWVAAVSPMHFDKKVAGVGLGRSFGIALAEANPGATIGLIPCAVGGSPISTWESGAYFKSTKSHPWDDAIRRARIALKSGTLKGILWHQGESDSKDSLAPVYEKKLHDLIARFRAELNAPGVPFIAGQMGQFKERPWSEAKKQVDRVHQELSSKVRNAAFVSSKGLAHKGDKVHFNAAGFREFGRRYATAYHTLAKGK